MNHKARHSGLTGRAHHTDEKSLNGSEVFVSLNIFVVCSIPSCPSTGWSGQGAKRAVGPAGTPAAATSILRAVSQEQVGGPRRLVVAELGRHCPAGIRPEFDRDVERCLAVFSPATPCILFVRFRRFCLEMSGNRFRGDPPSKAGCWTLLAGQCLAA
jgi:hypothetical protein